MRRLAAALFIGLIATLAVAAAPAARAKPPVWIVRDADSTIVLFGSVHVLPQGLDWRPQALTDALAKADDLWFEIPIDLSAQIESERAMEEHGLLKPREDLFDALAPDQAARLRRVCASLSLSEAAIGRMQPWYAEVTLSYAVDARAGATSSEGVEQQIQASAPPTARRRAFETVAQQIGFLSGARRADQVASLNETLEEIEERPESYQTVVADWMAGDAAAIEADALDPLLKASPGLFRRLITDRNRRWARVIANRLRGKGVTVIIVGAGHLVGPGGVPALLRAQGMTVEGP
jgi:uncharacterized protein YbaP (TraB family)